jgi:hypothetical protein
LVLLKKLSRGVEEGGVRKGDRKEKVEVLLEI